MCLYFHIFISFYLPLVSSFNNNMHKKKQRTSLKKRVEKIAQNCAHENRREQILCISLNFHLLDSNNIKSTFKS